MEVAGLNPARGSIKFMITLSHVEAIENRAKAGSPLSGRDALVACIEIRKLRAIIAAYEEVREK